MKDVTYTISQASELIGLKSYVLRYWEEELEIPIERNEMGHRCYTRYDIQLLLNVKELKEKGLQLRAIKDLINTKEIKTYVKENSEVLGDMARLEKKRMPEQKIVEFQTILEKLIARGLHEKDSDEMRYRNLDEAIRFHQQSRKQVAAACEKSRRKHMIKVKSPFFGRYRKK